MITFFSNWTAQRFKISKWLTISIILSLFILQICTLYEIYDNNRTDYTQQIFDNLIAHTSQLNLTKSNKSPLAYYSYNNKKHKLRIIKKFSKTDTTLQLTQNKAFNLIHCQATYDIRDCDIWKIDTLGQKLATTLKAQNLSTNFHLTLSDSQSHIIAKFQNNKLYLPFLNICKEIDLGFIEQHKLKITFTYPFHYFWATASNEIITTSCLFLVLIFSSISLFFQLRDEHRTTEHRKKFTHTLIHNLRSPLLATKQQLTAIEMLQFPADKQQETLRLCIQNTTNVLKDIEKLLYTSVNAYGLIAHREIFDPNQVIQKLISVYQQNHQNKKVDILVDCRECSTIEADPTLIEGAIGNLISNAMKYSGSEVHIYITCRTRPHKVFISVQDDGFGIAQNEQQYIFQENYRGKQYKNNRKYKGFGLGLFYVQAVVQAHRGKISVKSDGENGSIFIMELPQK